MSDLIGENGECRKKEGEPCTAIRVLLEPSEKDLGGFHVRRLLPTSEIRSVGPFIFFDHLGPVSFAPGEGIDVRPHPHIGLATITYLFEGEVLHRDSLGRVQTIRPNELNWMTAGRGIAHSERTPPGIRETGHTLHALQLWLALPESDEKIEPSFTHYGPDALPSKTNGLSTIRVMIGEAFGLTAQVTTYSPTLYVEVNLGKGESIQLPDHVEERAIYIISGEIELNERSIPQHSMAIFDSTAGVTLTAKQSAQFVIIGGAPLGKRIMWWNLVASKMEYIDEAKRAWKDKTFPQVPEETEYIPLPE